VADVGRDAGVSNFSRSWRAPPRETPAVRPTTLCFEGQRLMWYIVLKDHPAHHTHVKDARPRLPRRALRAHPPYPLPARHEIFTYAHIIRSSRTGHIPALLAARSRYARLPSARASARVLHVPFARARPAARLSTIRILHLLLVASLRPARRVYVRTRTRVRVDARLLVAHFGIPSAKRDAQASIYARNDAEHNN
jgi:hypothetical protein